MEKVRLTAIFALVGLAEGIHRPLNLLSQTKSARERDAIMPVNFRRDSEEPETKTCKRTLLPKLMLMGLPHAGSSQFAYLLNMHPELSFGHHKEHHFFASTAHGIIRNNSNPQWMLSLDEYKNQFEVNCDQKMTFDGDVDVVFIGNSKLPRGCCRSEPGKGAVKELRSILGDDTRFILIIRDPVDVINSLSKDMGSTLTEDPDNPIMNDMMCLADSLETWLSVFSPSQFLFLDADAVFANVTVAVDRALDFAKLSPRQYPIDLTLLTSVDSGRRRASPMSDHWRKTYNTDPRHVHCKQRLESLTGLSFRWGSSVKL